MKICFIGTGYVGLVSGTCFAEIGHDVICVDKIESKIRSLKEGIIPIYEPGLEDLVRANSKKGTLTFTNDLGAAVKASEVIFIAVGTPQSADGKADLTYVKDCVKEIALSADSEKLVITKSTVPVKTGAMVKDILTKANPEITFRVASNPEFLREGCAVADFMNPDRIIIGVDEGDDVSKTQIEELYAPLTSQGFKLLFSNIESAELIKYASNAFLATKITFINEIANLSEACGADISKISEAMGVDKRIAPYFLNPGPGYGGSCFPKDTHALSSIGKDFGVDLKLVDATIESNEARIDICINRIRQILNLKLKGANLTVLGAAFKGQTDDVRESPAIKIIKKLCAEGANIKLHDPQALENAKGELAEFDASIEYHEAQADLYNDADAILILTEWDEFKEIIFDVIKQRARSKIIIDFRNLLDKKEVEEAGFEYHCVGK